MVDIASWMSARQDCLVLEHVSVLSRLDSATAYTDQRGVCPGRERGRVLSTFTLSRYRSHCQLINNHLAETDMRLISRLELHYSWVGVTSQVGAP